MDVIEAVLRSNRGAVDTTIDQLLAMSADNDPGDTGLRQPTPPPEYGQALPSYGEAVAGEGAGPLGPGSLLSSDLLTSLGASGGPGPLHSQRGWRPPLLGKLPPDFLRLGPPRRSQGGQGHAYTHPERQGRPPVAPDLAQREQVTSD